MDANGTDRRCSPAAHEGPRTANRVRLARAALRQRVGTGDLTAAEVIVTCPWEAESMPIMDLPRSAPRGRTRCGSS